MGRDNRTIRTYDQTIERTVQMNNRAVRCEKWCTRHTKSSGFSIGLTMQGLKAPSIAKVLQEERLSCSRCRIAKFLKVNKATGLIARQPGSGQPSKIIEEIKHIVEEQMRLDDETTAHQLHRSLTEKGYSVSLRMILWCRTAIGWTFRGSAYCQLIRDTNKTKRLTWAQQHLHVHDSFEDII